MEEIDISGMIKEMRGHPEAERIGMILTHLGIVRGSSRDGRPVKAIHVSYNKDKVSDIINEVKKRDGIVDVLIRLNEGALNVGDPVMAISVGGDIRENVFPALMDAVNRIKKEACTKEEIFKE